ncbi:MAG: hypothetical protein K5899_10815 [Bacteroidaceae bacterium]|nr:hypothetical protein [Bacteroidaceae bacterium]
MKNCFLFMIAALAFHSGMRGYPSWEPIDDNKSKKCVTVTTLESNEKVFKARIAIHGYNANAINIDGTTYHQLSFDAPASLSHIGEPALPIISRFIALPKGEHFEVKIIEEKWSDNIHIGQVMPYQRSVLETEEEPPFEKNEAIYDEEVYQTDLLSVGELQKWRGVYNRVLNICPVRYMPRGGEVSFLKEFVLEILFDETAKNRPIQSSNMHFFLNQINTPEGERIEEEIRASAESYDYLIIAGNIPGVLECQALADFRRWKAFKGYKTKVVSTNSIGSIPSMIKNYISSERSKGVKYVLFIGDSDKIPLYNYYNTELHETAKSDYWYGCLDEFDDYIDLVADVSIGRFPTNDLTELTNMVNKTISYEKEPRNYGNEVLLVAHREDAPYKYQGCLESIRTGNYSESVSFAKAYGASSSVGGNNATNAYVVSEINEGKNIINYRGHGDYDQWQTWDSNLQSFYGNQIYSLNDSTNDVYFCITCQNGNINNQTCLMESFMRTNYGATGMIAPTEDTYTEVNHTYNQYLFSNLLNENIYNIGELNVVSHIANMWATTGEEQNKAIYNAFSYLCGGDPSLEIITGNTSKFDDCTLSLLEGDFIIDTENIGTYKVSIVNEDGTLSSVKYSTGSSCVFPMPTNNFYVALNKHNYVPRIYYINVTDNNIQDKVFDDPGIEHYYVKDAALNVGYDVTTSIPYGNVTIESGSILIIYNENGVLIKNGFECKRGGELQINATSFEQFQ